MFKELTNFKYDRNWKEAIGFYLGYFLFLLIIGITLATIFGLIFNFTYQDGVKMGIVIAVIACPTFCFIILYKKKILNKFILILLSVFSGVLALYGGAIFGLIIPAYFTTIKSQQ